MCCSRSERCVYVRLGTEQKQDVVWERRTSIDRDTNIVNAKMQLGKRKAFEIDRCWINKHVVASAMTYTMQ